MKKIIALLLALVCMFAFVACGEEQTPDNDDNNDVGNTDGNGDNNQGDDNQGDDNQGDDNQGDDNQGDDNQGGEDEPSDEEILAGKLEPFTLAITKTEPTKATVKTSIENELLGEPMTGTWNLTYNEDGTISMDYSYQYLIEELDGQSSPSLYEIKTGTATIDKDGNVTGADEQFTKVKAAALIKYNLDVTKLSDVKVGLDVLSAKVAAADTEAVLGVALGADAQFTMTVVENVLVSVTVNYIVDGIPATIVTSFE